MNSIFAGLDSPELEQALHWGGSQRIIPPAATWARIQPQLSQMGITRVANVTGLDRVGIPVMTAIRPNARSLAVAMGKGVDATAARVSAAMEAIESYHAERIEQPLRYTSFNDLHKQHPVVEVERLPFTAHSAFSAELPMLWIEARDWLSNEPLWVPYELVHTDYTNRRLPGDNCFLASSNGLASGNHPVEAFLHALFEVIERDATALWRHSGADVFLRTRLDLGSVDDPVCQQLIGQIQQAGLQLAVWNITSDIGIPVFACVIMDTDGSHAISDGMGCHCRREIALIRALTEAAQTRLGMIVSAREDIPSDEYLAAHTERNQQMRLLLRAGAARQQYPDVPTWPELNFRRMLELLAERLRRIECGQVLYLDLSRPEFNIAVMRVIVPGLEGPDEHPEYRPGTRALSL